MQSQFVRVSALNKIGLDSWFEVAQLLAAGAEKIARVQTSSDWPARPRKNAVTAAEEAREYTRKLYDTAQATGVELLALTQDRSAALRQGWFQALKDITDLAPGGKTGGTQAVIHSTRTTGDALAEGFARTATQSLRLADAVVKAASDTAAKAIESMADTQAG
jgi:hypothetical protein